MLVVFAFGVNDVAGTDDCVGEGLSVLLVLVMGLQATSKKNNRRLGKSRLAAGINTKNS